MRPVPKAEFFAAVNPLNVHPTIVTDRYPYTCEWRFLDRPHAPPFGCTVGRIEAGVTVQDYFLAP